jgi:hypothetical protein
MREAGVGRSFGHRDKIARAPRAFPRTTPAIRGL